MWKVRQAAYVVLGPPDGQSNLFETQQKEQQRRRLNFVTNFVHEHQIEIQAMPHERITIYRVNKRAIASRVPNQKKKVVTDDHLRNAHTEAEFG